MFGGGSITSVLLVGLLFFCSVICDRRFREKKANPTCNNGGSGVWDETEEFVCNCAPGFNGATCDNAVCKNGGTYKSTCTAPAQGTCTCTGKFYGDTCEKSCSSNFELLRDTNGLAVGCFSFVLTGDVWSHSQAACVARNSNAYMAVLNTAAKNEAVKARLRQFTANELSTCNYHFYTSGKRYPDNSCKPAPPRVYNFYWQAPNNDRVVLGAYSDWSVSSSDHVQNPSCLNGDENCLGLWGLENWQWNDFACYTHSCAVCEIDL